MLKKLLKLVRSEDNLSVALRQSGAVYDLSPNTPLVAANNDEPKEKPKMWLEDWSEEDEQRLKSGDHHWEGYVA